MIELNIRLDVRGQDNSGSAINRREIQALAVLGDCIHHRADVLVNGALVPRLVVGVTDASTQQLRHLADELHQDCIAAYWPSEQRGELLGSAAVAWGAFDLTRFRRLDVVTAYGESTGFGWDQRDTDRFRARRST
jgi:hypothetical protein